MPASGTAAFPAIYRGDPHPLVLLPHSSGWQVMTMTMLVGAAIMAAASDASGGRALMAFGFVTLGLTIGNCMRYALHTDLAGVPPVTRSPRTTGLLARLLIALLHYLQPLARLQGHIRGHFKSPERAVQPPPAAADAAGTPTLAAAQLLSARGDQQQFWAESSLSAAMLLDRVATELRSTRVSTLVEVDSGWWTERDISVPVGALARVDLRMLVEDHGAGRSLVRAATKIRLSALGAVGSLGAFAVGGMARLAPAC